MPDLDDHLKDIRRKCKQGDYLGALRTCDIWLSEHPDCHKVLAERGAVQSSLGHVDSAIEDMSRVIALKPEEPHFRFERAHYLIDAQRYEEAIEDLTEILRLCDVWGRDYYRDTARFVRGYANLRLGRPTEAINDCSPLKDDFRWWIEHGLRTKATILAEAEALLIDQRGIWHPEGR
jgi:tetratricopeptide (TPR) repeat protein